MGKFGDYTVPGTVTRLAPNAFHECHALCSITVPTKVGELDSDTFKGCARLNSTNIIRK